MVSVSMARDPADRSSRFSPKYSMTENLVHASTIRLRGLSGSAFSVAVGPPAGSSCRSSVVVGAGVVAACSGVGGSSGGVVRASSWRLDPSAGIGFGSTGRCGVSGDFFPCL